MIGEVLAAVRPLRRDGRGEGWSVLVARHDQIDAWLKSDGLTVVKVHELLRRQGVVVAQRTLHRYVLEVLGHGRGRGRTVRVNDGEPGSELQVDFARMGLINDAASGRRRVCHALIFTAVFSRHRFVWLTVSQTTADVIAGCEAAWRFSGGVFRVVIPENVPRHIFRVLWPASLCVRWSPRPIGWSRGSIRRSSSTRKAAAS